ncbi:MAG TPA: hypothetical protein P5110_01050 [Candidatus Omnitrophota bacterium]|nr:hypothetical protein [Candidatus Omnitrophota bacterium]
MSANSAFKEFSIPANLGNVKEIYQPETTITSKTIIQIQDAHCNYEAQKNLAQILDYLVKNYNLRLIMVEGGSGDVSLSFLRRFANKSARFTIADKYLKMGKISGEEYLDIVSDYDLELFGIEDEFLYESNLSAFLNLDEYRGKAVQEADNLKKTVDALKLKIFNPELLALEEEKKEFELKKLTLAEYVVFLKGLAETRGIALKDYVNSAAFVQSILEEKTLDFKKAEAQRGEFIKELARLAGDKVVKELIAKTQDFKNQKIAAADYYGYLNGLAESRVNIKEKYPDLAQYMAYLARGVAVNAPQLLKELSALESAIKERMFVKNDERRLDDISAHLDIFSRFLKLDLTPEEYQRFSADRAAFTPAAWSTFLNDNCRRFGVSGRIPASPTIADNMDKLEQFYSLGLDREQSFIQNINQKMSESSDAIAVVITGGFHTPGISRLLKEKGYAYAIVTPTITQQTDESIYFSVLRETKSPLPDDLEIEIE